jgi:hypothetical protein
MNDVDVVREVTDVIQGALNRNRRIETILIAILAGIAFTGVGLLVYGASIRSWEVALPGSISELAIVMPIRYLTRLRQENLRLEVIPQLIRLADTANRKKLVFDLISRLIEQIPS